MDKAEAEPEPKSALAKYNQWFVDDTWRRYISIAWRANRTCGHCLDLDYVRI